MRPNTRPISARAAPVALPFADPSPRRSARANPATCLAAGATGPAA